MSKKTMLLALAMAALFAIPSAASAQEIHFKGVTTFSGKGPANSLQAVNEPKLSSSGVALTGSFSAGSTTTGNITLDISGLFAEFLGIKGSCNTVGDSSGIVTMSAAYHLITTPASKPGILLTPATTTIICIGFSRIEITGNGIIGTITSPACGGKSKTLTVSFQQAGGTQKHLEYTGNKYDLTAETENAEGKTTGASGTIALEGTTTLESTTEGTLECT